MAGTRDAYTVRALENGLHDHPYLNQRTIDASTGTHRMRRPGGAHPATGERWLVYSLDGNLECGCRISECIPGATYSGPGVIANGPATG